MTALGLGGRLVAATLFAAAAVAAPGAARAAEEPAYTVLERDGRIELREYAPVVIAETVVEGDLATASNAGFRRLAGYIFGGNRSVRAGGASEKIEMTAPVTVQPAPGTASPASDAPSERIAMTAPVTVERQDGAVPAPGQPGRWRVQFTMPRDWTLATLPRPNDPTVVLREVPAMRQAVLGFSGLAGEEAVREATDTLLAWVAARGLAPLGAPQLARYDPPWTLPFLRRNEVMVTVATP